MWQQKYVCHHWLNRRRKAYMAQPMSIHNFQTTATRPETKTTQQKITDSHKISGFMHKQIIWDSNKINLSRCVLCAVFCILILFIRFLRVRCPPSYVIYFEYYMIWNGANRLFYSSGNRLLGRLLDSKSPINFMNIYVYFTFWCWLWLQHAYIHSINSSHYSFGLNCKIIFISIHSRFIIRSVNWFLTRRRAQNVFLIEFYAFFMDRTTHK